MSPDSGMVLPPGWNELSPLLDQLLEAPPSLRSALLDRLTDVDTPERTTLTQWLQECSQELPLLDRAAAEQFDTLLDEDPPLAAPAVVGRRYRLERELGHGGMAIVFRATDLTVDRPVAIKVIRPGLAASLGRDRFLREIDIAARLRHPNIVAVLDSGHADGCLFFVMPCLPDGSLRDRLDAGHVVPIAEAIGILRDVARALKYAHRNGVVHRDIKPGNVLLSAGTAVVADFGIAKALLASLPSSSTGPITLAGTAIGTPAYMSPEQALGDPDLDHRADLYSFGCLGYELLAGRPPFDPALNPDAATTRFVNPPPPVSIHRTNAPAAIATLLARCLEPRPADRPADAEELIRLLSEVGQPEA